MRKLLAAIADAIRSAVGTLRKVAKVTSKGLAWVWEKVPSFSLGFGGGGGSHEPDELDVAQQAAKQAQAQQQKEDARAEIDTRAQCVLRVARALRDGKEPEPEDAAILSPAHVRYLLGLSRGELEILAAASMAGLKARRAFVAGLKPPDGCRSVHEVMQGLEKKPVSPSEHRCRTLADKIRVRRQGTQDLDVIATVKKYSQAA